MRVRGQFFRLFDTKVHLVFLKMKSIENRSKSRNKVIICFVYFGIPKGLRTSSIVGGFQDNEFYPSTKKTKLSSVAQVFFVFLESGRTSLKIHIDAEIGEAFKNKGFKS